MPTTATAVNSPTPACVGRLKMSGSSSFMGWPALAASAISFSCVALSNVIARSTLGSPKARAKPKANSAATRPTSMPAEQKLGNVHRSPR